MNHTTAYRESQHRRFEVCTFFGACLLLALTFPQMAVAHAPNAEEDAALSLEILGGKPDLVPIVLDMSNDKHYQFFKNRLLATGQKEGSEIFGRIEKARKKHRNSGVPKPGFVVLDLSDASQVPQADASQVPQADANQSTPAETGPVLSIVGFVVEDDGNYSITAYSSIPDQPEISYVGIEIREGGQLVASDSITQDYEGADQHVTLVGHMPRYSGGVVEAKATFYWEKSGAHSYMVKAETSPPEILTVWIQDPSDTKGAGGQPDGKIKLCLGRQGQDCDYRPPNTSATNVFFPVRGWADYIGDIQQPFTEDNSSSVLTVSNPQAGGGCYLIEGTTDFFSYATVEATGITSKLKWNIPEQKFLNQSAWECLAVNARNYYTHTIEVTVRGKPVFLTIADRALEGEGRQEEIRPFYVYYSCLAQGTEVLLADGREVAIEHVRRGDQVRTDDGVDDVLTVRTTYQGVEKTPLVRLVTGGGHSLLLTEGHPVITPGGIELAKYLRVGNEVNTSDGVSTLLTVTREAYDGKVHNLGVGQDGDALARTADNTTFYANGIQVGDNEMQFTFAHQGRQSDPKVARESPGHQQEHALEVTADDR